MPLETRLPQPLVAPESVDVADTPSPGGAMSMEEILGCC